MLKTLRSVLRFRPIELNAVRRRLVRRPLGRVVSVSDLRAMAKRRLPRGVFDYIEGGAEDEVTMARNVAAYGRVEFRPRVLRDTTSVDTKTIVLGREVAFPLVLAPVGCTRVADPAGELAVARAATRAGIPYALSTAGTRSIEKVAEVSDGSLWFQLFMWRDRGLLANLLERAAAAGYEALCLTVDSAVMGRRDRDVRRGFTLPPRLGMATIFDGMLHPRWTWDFVRAEPITFATVGDGAAGIGGDAVSQTKWTDSQFDPGVSWRDVEWLRSKWNGPIVLKGIQTVDDGEIAAGEGVDAIALSNHGGRQLDSSQPTLELLPNVVDAVGGSIEILCDGGVRSGSDIVKAVALGAGACMAGRAYMYALGVLPAEVVDEDGDG